MKFGIVGSGTMGEIYAGALAQRGDAQLLGIVGNTEGKLKKLGEKFRCETFPEGNVPALLARHPEIDSLIIATPETVRIAPLEAALPKVKNILLEKPFSTSWAEAKKLQQMLTGVRGHLAICHVLRHSPRFAAAKAGIANGEVGKVLQLFARRNSNSTRVQRVLGRFPLAHWLSPHDIDLMRWFTGEEITSVFASSIAGAEGKQDNILTLLQLSSGANAVLENSWCTPPLSGKAMEAFFEIRGNKGKIEVHDYEMNVNVFGENSRLAAPDTYEDYLLHGVRGGFFTDLIDHFIRRARSNASSADRETAIRDGLETTRAGEMIRLSLSEKRVVHRNEIS